MGLLDVCESLFGTRCLYEALGADKSASEAELKKAYLKQSLLCHPDKGGSAEKFVCLGKVHALLSDANKRAFFDETGRAEEDEEDGAGPASDFDWEVYWRALFPEVTVDKIEAFGAKYRGSDEEKTDVLKSYVANKGDMALVVDEIMLSEMNDIGRFVQDYILPAIADGSVARFSRLGKFENMPVVPLSKKSKPAKSAPKPRGRPKGSKKRENRDDDDEGDDFGDGGENVNQSSAALAVQLRRKKGSGALDELVARLSARHGAKQAEPEPQIDDDEFNRIQAEMLSRNKSKKMK